MLKGIYEVPNSMSAERLTVYKEGKRYVAYNGWGKVIYNESSIKDLKEALSYRGYKKAKYSANEVARYGYVKEIN